SSPLPQISSPPLPASPPILPIPLPAASPPLQLLSFDRRADRPEVTLPPRKRLSIVHCPRYEAGESSVAAAARPIEGRRADYGFVDSVEAEIRRRRAKDVGYGIRDTWIDPRDVDEEEAPTTLEGVNTRVTELAAVQEQDTQDIHGVMEDTQGRQTDIFQRVEALVDDSQYHYETGRLVDQEARCSREAWAHSIGLSSAVHFELQGYMTDTWAQDQRIDAQDTLIATLTTQLSSLQGHPATALGEIRALHAREQARAAGTTTTPPLLVTTPPAAILSQLTTEPPTSPAAATMAAAAAYAATFTTATPLTPATTAGATATAVAFPAAAAAVAGCGWQNSQHRRGGANTNLSISCPLGCPPPNNLRGGGRTTVQPPQPHLVVSGLWWCLDLHVNMPLVAFGFVDNNPIRGV
nr:hypothetical protein [Tanacetum cinerariifolium]